MEKHVIYIKDTFHISMGERKRGVVGLFHSRLSGCSKHVFCSISACGLDDVACRC